jgi:hypothetical protein
MLIRVVVLPRSWFTLLRSMLPSTTTPFRRDYWKTNLIILLVIGIIITIIVVSVTQSK